MNKINEKAIQLDKTALGYLISIAISDLVDNQQFEIMNTLFTDPTELVEVVSQINDINVGDMTVQEQGDKVASTLRNMIDSFKSL
ncbi:hypothetical protein P4639_22395 [Priestia megaterium]|uniref:hypothetical protein n=1 Tax=Priestia megaterium TaxID=1404 RepID=UPI002E235B38|nr:hypothetical protein [Priestia megaterium]